MNEVWLKWIALAVTCGAMAWTGTWLARRFPTKALLVALPLAAVGALVQSLITRPPREEWAHLHSFESAFSNHFCPPAIAFLAALWAGIALDRAKVPSWVTVPIAALAGVIVEFVVAFGMLIAM